MLGALGGSASAEAVADSAEDWAVESSEALSLARRVWDDWWYRFTEFEPRPVTEVIALLERIQNCNLDGARAEGDCTADGLLATLKQYLYGKAPMREALRKAREVFLRFPDEDSRGVTSRRQRMLLVVSDGHSTDPCPIGTAQGMTAPKNEKDRVTLAVVHLTSESRQFRYKLHDCEQSHWDKGRRTLFQLASRIPCELHPIPVLVSMGCQLPSSNEAALYVELCSATVLEEFCSALLSARFGSADTLFDIIGRVQLDAIVNDAHVRTHSNPTDQGKSKTCYAHAIAAVVHMALSRVYALRGGLPSVKEIRERILHDFRARDEGWPVEDILDKMKKERWYRPILRYSEKDEDGARQALLQRRPVLATFYLSETGWQKFGEHFSEEKTKYLVLDKSDMEMHYSGKPDGGHAVVLTGCSPDSLTFLNSWGSKWGANGLFSVRDPSVLVSSGSSMHFYDIGWFESDLLGSEKAAYDARVDAEVDRHARAYPTLFEFGVTCPLCGGSSPIAHFTGCTRQAICPRCHGSFKPEPGHLVQALYARYGLEDIVQ